MKTNPDLDAAQFQTRIRFAEMAARRGDVKATRIRYRRETP